MGALLDAALQFTRDRAPQRQRRDPYLLLADSLAVESDGRGRVAQQALANEQAARENLTRSLQVAGQGFAERARTQALQQEAQADRAQDAAIAKSKADFDFWMQVRKEMLDFTKTQYESAVGGIKDARSAISDITETDFEFGLRGMKIEYSPAQQKALNDIQSQLQTLKSSPAKDILTAAQYKEAENDLLHQQLEIMNGRTIIPPTHDAYIASNVIPLDDTGAKIIRKVDGDPIVYKPDKPDAPEDTSNKDFDTAFNLAPEHLGFQERAAWARRYMQERGSDGSKKTLVGARAFHPLSVGGILDVVPHFENMPQELNIDAPRTPPTFEEWRKNLSPEKYSAEIDRIKGANSPNASLLISDEEADALLRKRFEMQGGPLPEQAKDQSRPSGIQSEQAAIEIIDDPGAPPDIVEMALQYLENLENGN